MVENGAGESTEPPFNQHAPNQRPHCACLDHKHVSLQRPFLQDDTNTDYAPFDIADPTLYAALQKAYCATRNHPTHILYLNNAKNPPKAWWTLT
jgi:hypothetical protein